MALVSCGGFHPATTTPVTVSAQLPVGAQVAVVECGDSTYVFERGLASIVRGGKVLLHVDAPDHATWETATTIDAPDGHGRWVVALAGHALWRIDAAGALEHVDERLGVPRDGRVLALDAAGPTAIIGLADGAVVVTSGGHVLRFSGFPAPAVAAARDRVAIASPAKIDVFDLAAGARRSYALDDVARVGFRDAATSHATLVAERDGALYEETGGKLVHRQAPRLDDLATSGARLWLAAGGALYAEDARGQLAGVEPAVARIARVWRSGSGGVWVDSGAHETVRYTLAVPHRDDGWQATVEPVFERACAGCHLPGGDADIDLSTPEEWQLRRAALLDRVVVSRTMPPAGHPLDEADRRALEAWLRAAR